MSPLKKSMIIIFFVLLIDQVVKVWIKTNMYLGQEFHITDWFIIHFVENEGMAFGMKFGGNWGKIALTCLRIVAVIFMGFGIVKLVRQKFAPGFIYTISLIVAGAMGNIIDSVFYGVLFGKSLPVPGTGVAAFMQNPGGIGQALQGKVVDMLYFPLFSGTFPDWFPIWSNEDFVFFRPIFNIADTAITIGVILIMLFYRKSLMILTDDKKQE